jgi:hypothetical protein
MTTPIEHARHTGTPAVTPDKARRLAGVIPATDLFSGHREMRVSASPARKRIPGTADNWDIMPGHTSGRTRPCFDVVTSTVSARAPDADCARKAGDDPSARTHRFWFVG